MWSLMLQQSRIGSISLETNLDIYKYHLLVNMNMLFAVLSSALSPMLYVLCVLPVRPPGLD